MSTERLLIGGYTADGDGRALGIRRVDVTEDGGLVDRGDVGLGDSPTFLIRRGDVIVAAAEAAARIDSYRLAGDRLERIASHPAAGGLPCHLSLAGSDHLIVSCYADGRIGRHEFAADGSAGPLVQVLEPTPGEGPPNNGGGHAHYSRVLDDGRVLTIDLGYDALNIHDQREDGALTRVATTWLRPGSGPRHAARHPSGHLYILTELSKEIVVLDAHASVLSYVSLDVAGPAAPSEISVSDDGRFVYAAVREQNLIVVFEAVDDGAALRRLAAVDTEGEGPRQFLLRGRHLFVGNQHSDTVAIFDVASDGIPVFRSSIPVPSPVFFLDLDPLPLT